MIARLTPCVKSICVMSICALLVAGCSGSSDSASNEGSTATVEDGMTTNANEATEAQQNAQNQNDNLGGSVNQQDSNATTESTETSSNTSSTETSILELTRVTFNITVPVYVSDALQVRLTWGDTDITGSWVADESWVIESDLPTNTNNLLTVMFNDDNGAIVLGSFETNFASGSQATQTYTISADDFDTTSWDNDGDGFSNLDESLTGTNPQAMDAPRALQASLTLEPGSIVRINWQASPRADYYRVFENHHGLSALTQISDDLNASTEEFSLTVPLHKRANAKYMVQACNAVDCTDSTSLLDIGSLEDGLIFVSPDHTESGDQFGNSVAFSADGQTLVIGAPTEDSAATGINGDPFDNSLANSISPSYLAGTGAAYVFSRVDGQWQQQAYLKASNTGRSDQFGSAVSVSADGNTIAVGAYGEASSSTGINGNQSDDSAIIAGAVYVFARSNGVWTQQAYVKASNTQQDNYFGRAVSLSANGNTLAVGAHNEKSDTTEVNGDQTQNSNSNSGAVYIYTRQNNLWSQQAYLKAFREGSDACCFGGLGTVLSLSADGQTLAAGMQFRTERAIIFTQANGSWQQTATIESPNRHLDGDFGEKLSLSGDGQTIAITAVGESPRDDQGNRIIGTGEGVAYVFALEEGEWQEQAYLYIEEHPNGRLFGRDTDISSDGNTMAVSFNANRIYIYTRNEDTWTNVSILPDTTPIPTLIIDQPRLNGNGDSMATVGGRPTLGEFGAYLF